MTVGTPPGTGPQLVDGAWLQGLAGGTNQTYVSGLVANATTQATATSIPANTNIVEFDTVASSGAAVLPAAVAGTDIAIINNGANPLQIFANLAVNQLTAAQDTINALSNGTALAVTNATIIIFICAKNGHWLTK